MTQIKMKNSNGIESAVKKAALTPPDIAKVMPSSQDNWPTHVTRDPHVRDISQGSASSIQYATQLDAITEGQKLLGKQGADLTQRKNENSDQISKIELLRVENEAENEVENLKFIHKKQPSIELSMIRPILSDELKEQFNLHINITGFSEGMGRKSLSWINHLGDKFVTVEIYYEEIEAQDIDDSVDKVINHYIFRLYNTEYKQIGYFKYKNDLLDQTKISDGDITFSPDSHYFGIIFGNYSNQFLGIAYFSHGFEHDMFVEQQYGQAALDLMFKNSNQYVQFNRQFVLDVSCTQKELNKYHGFDSEGGDLQEEDDLEKSMNEIVDKSDSPEKIISESIQVRISKTNFIYLFRNVQVSDYIKSKRFNVYKSNMTVKDYLGAIQRISASKASYDFHYEYKRINMLDHFSRLQTLENKVDNMYLRGPLAIGIVKQDTQDEDEEDEDEDDDEDYDDEDEDEEAFKIEFLFDYQENKMVVFDFNKKLDGQEMQKLKNHLIYQPSLGQGQVKWYFVCFGVNYKIHIFRKFYNERTQEISFLYRYSLQMPKVDEEDDTHEPLKIIRMKTFIFGDKFSSLIYFNKEEIVPDEFLETETKSVTKREIFCPQPQQFEYIHQMHQSSLLRLNENLICNYQKDPMDFYATRVMIPESINPDKSFENQDNLENKTCSQIIGINCFEEVLTKWDFRIYLNDQLKSIVQGYLSQEIEVLDLIFYSKRLNIAIFVDKIDSGEKEINHRILFVDLRGKSKPINIYGIMRLPIIRSVKDEEKEILRVFIVSGAQNLITCHSFTCSIDRVIESKFTPQSQISENEKVHVSQIGVELIIFYQQSITILYLNNPIDEKFKIQTTITGIPFSQINEFYFCENRIMINESKIQRVSQDFSIVEAANEFIYFTKNIYGEYDKFQTFYGFQIGDLHFGVFCMQDNQNSWGKVLIYEISSMLLKAQITKFEMDLKFQDKDQVKLESFSSELNDSGVLFFKPRKDKPFNQQYILKLKLYNQELDAVCGIPFKMLIRPNVISQANMETGDLTYYPMNLGNKIQEFSMLTKIKLRYYFDPMLDFVDISSQNTLIQNENEVLQRIQKASLKDLTSYNVINRSYYFCNIQRNPQFKKFVNHVLKRLEYVSDNIPFILCEDIDGINPLQETLQNFNGSLAQSILQLCISGDESGLLYPSAINVCLQQLIKMGLDLKPYLSSNLPYHQVEDLYNFGTYETDPNYRLISSNKQTLIQTLLNKEINVSEKQDLKGSISRLLLNEDKESQRYRIAYSIVNMKELIGRTVSIDPRDSIKIISDLSKNDVSYYDIEVLQAIIKFKWQTYTRKYFLWQFIFLIIFLAVYVIDLIFGSKTFGLSIEYQWMGFVATRATCQLILIYFLQFEVKQLISNGFLEYFSSVWNVNDLVLQLVYTSYLILSFVAPTELYAIKSLQSFIIYVTFVKIGFYMRTFSELSFLVQMLLNVFYDLRFFLFFFGVVIVSFSLYLGILVNELTDYEGIGIFGYFAIALRTSLGDYDFDSFVKNSDYDILTWFVWLLMMIVGNVIFMNFIIAVVSQSYENCMQSMNAQSYKNKVDLIMERESLMNEADLTNSEWFPNFIIVRKPLLDGEDSSQLGETQGEWQGMLKEMQKGVKKQIDIIREEMKKNNIKIENQINQVNLETMKAMTEIKEMLQKKEKEENEQKKKK